MTTSPSHNAEGHQTWNPSVGRYFEPASNQRESYGGVVGALQDQLASQGSVNKAYPHSFAGIIAAIEDLVFTQKEVPVVPNVKPPGGDAVPDGSGGYDWVWAQQPRDGELWYDTRQGRMFIALQGEYYQTNGADGLAQVTTDSTAPTTPVVGQFWWDSSESALYIFDGFWRDAEGNIKDSFEPGYTPVWRLVVEDGGVVNTMTTSTLQLSPATPFARNATGGLLPGLGNSFLVQTHLNAWVFNALETLEAAIESGEHANVNMEMGTTAPSNPVAGDFFYDTGSSELLIYNDSISQWVPVIATSQFGTQISNLTSQLQLEASARQTAVASLHTKIDNTVASSSVIQTLTNALTTLEVEVAARPALNQSEFATITSANALSSRIGVLENAVPDHSALQTKVQAAAQTANFNTIISNLASSTELLGVQASIPDISNLATTQDVTNAVSNITTEYLPRTGGTLSGSFVVQKEDAANPAFDFSTQKSYGQNTHKYLSNGQVEAYATFGTNDRAWEYAWEFGMHEDFCWKHAVNGKVFSVNRDGAAAKDVVLADFGENLATGVVLQNPISLRAKVAEYDSQLSTARADITALQQHLGANSKAVYYGDSAPTGNLDDGDLWFDSRNLRMNVRHGGYWLFPDRVEDLALKADLFNAVQTSTDFDTLKIKLLAVLV